MPNTTNFNWATPADTDLVKDGAAAIRTLGNSIDSSFVDLKGGTTGQVLSKTSNTDLDFTWIAGGDITEVQAGTGISVASGTGPIPVVTSTVATTFDAKGDLVVGTGADTFAKLSVGTNGHTLVADSAETTGLKWQAPAGGGKVLQVVAATTSTQALSTSSTLADTGLTASITPSSATSKILVLVTQNGVRKDNSTTARLRMFLNRAGTDIIKLGEAIAEDGSTGKNDIGTVAISYLDSPATTSATTYKTRYASENAVNGVYVQYDSAVSSIVLLEIGA